MTAVSEFVKSRLLHGSDALPLVLVPLILPPAGERGGMQNVLLRLATNDPWHNVCRNDNGEIIHLAGTIAYFHALACS